MGVVDRLEEISRQLPTMATNGHTNGANGASDLGSRNYIRWDAEGVEKVPPHEKEDIQNVANMINGAQHMNFNNHRHVYGGEWQYYQMCGWN